MVNYIQTVGQHYVLIREGNSTENALISMSSSQGKVSRKWNSMMMSITLDGKMAHIHRHLSVINID